ncbi:MAG: ADP-ribosylglycohydrolase family protein [Ilumatobacteraceae bacterium]
MSSLNSTPGRQRAIGCIVGSAVGDALGAPFEFGEPGAYSDMFPQTVHSGIGEMVGNQIWQPGQFTDDTEMGVIVAESLLESNGIDAEDQLTRFRAWGRCAKDVGNLTREVLESSQPAPEAAYEVLLARAGHNTAGNGSIMRAAAGAVYFASHGRAATIDAALKLSAVTHADPLCLWAVAMQHELLRVALEGGDPIDSIDEVVEMLPDEIRPVYEPLLTSSWTPKSGGPGNGSAMGALAQAVWALRRFDTFEQVVIAVIDLGRDTDSVAAVAGALAGAKFGIQSIPSRWVTYLSGQVTDTDGKVRHYDHLALQQLALSLVGHPSFNGVDDEPAMEPREVMPGLWASNRAGARTVPDDWAVVSLCRIDQAMRHPIRREAYLIDRDGGHNPALAMVVDDVLDSIDAFLAEGRHVVVHCHGGRSRTGLVLAAEMMRHGRSFADAKDLLAKTWPDAYFLNAEFVDELQLRDR